MDAAVLVALSAVRVRGDTATVWVQFWFDPVRNGIPRMVGSGYELILRRADGGWRVVGKGRMWAT